MNNLQISRRDVLLKIAVCMMLILGWTGTVKAVTVHVQKPTSMKFISSGVGAAQMAGPGGAYTFEIDDKDGLPIKNQPSLTLTETYQHSTDIVSGPGVAPFSFPFDDKGGPAANGGTDGNGCMTDTPVSLLGPDQVKAVVGTAYNAETRNVPGHHYYVQDPYNGSTGCLFTQDQVITGTITWFSTSSTGSSITLPNSGSGSGIETVTSVSP